MKRLAILMTASLSLAACTTVVPGTPSAQQRPVGGAGGPGRVMGQSAAGLVALFGEPDQDFRETTGRKLQFANENCVLDTYLYAQGAGSEPVVTHVDARNPVGEDVDKEACVAALARR